MICRLSLFCACPPSHACCSRWVIVWHPCLQGHRGRGPWSCALLSRSTPAQLGTAAPPNNAAHAAGEEQAAAAGTAQEAASAAAAAGCYLLTGGADASIKCWTLADWLPSPAAAACPAPAAGAEFYTLQGLPPCPEATAVGQCRSYELLAAQHSAQQAQQDDGAQQELQQGQQAEAGAVTARDSRAEWARCLALASDVRWSAGSGGGSSSSANSNSSGGGSSSSSSGGPSPQPCQQRQLYVATNRGLVHRVQLPGKLQKNAMLAVAGCCQDYTSLCGVHTTEGTAACFARSIPGAHARIYSATFCIHSTFCLCRCQARAARALGVHTQGGCFWRCTAVPGASCAAPASMPSRAAGQP